MVCTLNPKPTGISQITVADNQRVSIELRAGRGENGYSATLDITTITETNEKPKKAPKASKTQVFNEASKNSDNVLTKGIRGKTPSLVIQDESATEDEDEVTTVSWDEDENEEDKQGSDEEEGEKDSGEEEVSTPVRTSIFSKVNKA